MPKRSTYHATGVVAPTRFALVSCYMGDRVLYCDALVPRGAIDIRRLGAAVNGKCNKATLACGFLILVDWLTHLEPFFFFSRKNRVCVHAEKECCACALSLL